MPYPPPVPPATRTDATVMATNHPSDHNLISAALTEILNHVATLEASLYPIGTIAEWGGDLAPGNHELLRGQAVSRVTYPEVFALYGTKFGAGDGSTTFNLPNFQGRTPYGVWPGGPYGAALGAIFGNSVATLPSHQHSGVDHLHPAGGLTIAQHNHGPVSGPGYVVYAPGGSGQFLAFGGPGGMEFATPGSTDYNAAQGIGGSTGAADRPLTTGFAGVDPTNANLSPGLAINFIMRMH